MLNADKFSRKRKICEAAKKMEDFAIFFRTQACVWPVCTNTFYKFNAQVASTSLHRTSRHRCPDHVPTVLELELEHLLKRPSQAQNPPYSLTDFVTDSCSLLQSAVGAAVRDAGEGPRDCQRLYATKSCRYAVPHGSRIHARGVTGHGSSVLHAGGYCPPRRRDGPGLPGSCRRSRAQPDSRSQQARLTGKPSRTTSCRNDPSVHGTAP